MAPSLEIHLEAPWHAVQLPEEWPKGSETLRHVTLRLLEVLVRHNVQATWYILGHLANHQPDIVRVIARRGHQIGSHGYWHRHGEWQGDASDILARQVLPLVSTRYRSPYWDTTPCPGASGGVWFRTLPYGWLKRNIQRTGVLWLHPHDLEDWWGGGPLRRHLFFCQPWQRLERLLNEMDWDAPRGT